MTGFEGWVQQDGPPTIAGSYETLSINHDQRLYEIEEAANSGDHEGSHISILQAEVIVSETAEGTPVSHVFPGRCFETITLQ